MKNIDLYNTWAANYLSEQNKPLDFINTTTNCFNFVENYYENKKCFTCKFYLNDSCDIPKALQLEASEFGCVKWE